MTAHTPLRKQYLDIKRRYGNAILLFRIGDFYEAFDQDAHTIARELDIVLTSKPMGKDLRVPLAGVPHHSLERHLATLINRGYRVAICEQLTPAAVRGEGGSKLIERDVVRIVTPGTVLEPGLLSHKVNNYLAALVVDGRQSGIAYADVTTGEFAATECNQAEAILELQRIAPAEILIQKSSEIKDAELPGIATRLDDRTFETEAAKLRVLKHFEARSLAAFGLASLPLATSAAGSIIAYLEDSQVAGAAQLTRLKTYQIENYMLLDRQTMRSLEIFESGSNGPTLLKTIDRTRTAIGGRMLRRWLRQPLLNQAEIIRRQEDVRWFCEREAVRSELITYLKRVHDLERLTTRVRAGLSSPQELLALGASLEAIPFVRNLLGRNAQQFQSLLAVLPACQEADKLIHRAIVDSVPSRKPDNIIREGYSEELDRLRSLLRDGKNYLAEMEQRERARTGIKSLRVGYNKVFGYYIEVTRPNLHLVPEGYTRKQTLSTAERFITLELKEYESMVVHAKERIIELEANLFRRICTEIGLHRDEILTAARTIAYLDVILSFAETAQLHNYVRPSITDTNALVIKEGRHPVLEQGLKDGSFVSNDTELAGREDDAQGSRSLAPQIALITGPNMSGKSTFLRQTALIVLLAQIGSFVPAREASISLCDRIFTRTGLYDRIGSGESTFMTEMIETAEILHGATPRSLILLDELGRGTSTYDGLAVARAVLEYIHNHPQLGSKTLFATHYHELTELADVLPAVQNLHVEIEEQGSELVFRYRIKPGSAKGSYGVYAAKLAGLPRPVVRRAEQLLAEFEADTKLASSMAEASTQTSNASAANRSQDSKVVRALLDTDPNSMSPVEALMKLYELRKQAEAEKATEAKPKKGSEERSVRAVKRA